MNMNMADLFRKFECPLCMTIYQKPIYQCSTGHSLCANCKQSFQQCPCCTKPFLDTRNYALEDIMGIMQIPCNNKPCSEFIILDKYALHLSECQFRRLKCKFHGCTWIGSKTDVYHHIQRMHKTVIVKKDEKIQPHQLTECFIQHDKNMFYICKHSESNFITWSAESTNITTNINLLLAIKISKPNEDSYTLMTQPITKYTDRNSDKSKDDAVVWVVKNKLKECNIQITIGNP